MFVHLLLSPWLCNLHLSEELHGVVCKQGQLQGYLRISAGLCSVGKKPLVKRLAWGRFQLVLRIPTSSCLHGIGVMFRIQYFKPSLWIPRLAQSPISLNTKTRELEHVAGRKLFYIVTVPRKVLGSSACHMVHVPCCIPNIVLCSLWDNHSDDNLL